MLSLYKHTNQKLKQWAKYIVQQARTRLSKAKKNASKGLYKSIEANILETKDNASIVVNYNDYGKFIDHGVKGTDKTYPESAMSKFRFRPSSKVLGMELATGTFAKWAKSRNIRFRDDKGKFKKGNYKSIGIAFALSVKKKGIRATHFMSKTIETSVDKFEGELKEALKKDIINLLKDGKN